MFALRLLGFFSCISAIYAAPIPEPVNPGDIVTVAPDQATTHFPGSSRVPHPGVVLGPSNQWEKHQVAIITNHPPDTNGQKHQLLSDFQPGHRLTPTSHVGTSKPATYLGSQLTPWTGGGVHHAQLTSHELTALKDKIHENNPGAIWHHGAAGGTTHTAQNAAAGSSTVEHQPAPAPAHPAPAPAPPAPPAPPAAGRGRGTFRGAAHGILASNRLNPIARGGRKARRRGS